MQTLQQVTNPLEVIYNMLDELDQATVQHLDVSSPVYYIFLELELDRLWTLYQKSKST